MSKKATIKITSDTKDAETGLDKVSKKINEFSKSNNQNLSGLKRLNGAITGAVKSFGAVGAAVGVAVTAIKKANEAIKETTELYRVQATAEKQLEVAARNNPYLDDGSVMQLKNYASQLQRISTVGDEQLLPMMAQLASAGRTQEEIQNIMSAALDVSASGMMSLDSAVTALNKTFSGSTGTLGNQIAELKGLTKEELESGKAIDIVAEKFKGMSEETAKATGSTEQLKNAMSDYKEEVGATFEKKLAPMRRFFTELIQGWADAKKAKREYEEAVEANTDPAKQTIETLTKEIDGLQEKIDNYYETLHSYQNMTDAAKLQLKRTSGGTFDVDKEIERIQNEISEQSKLLTARREERRELQLKINAQKTAAQLEAEAAEEQAKKEAEANALLERRNKLREDYAETLRKTQEQINNRRTLGEEISEETEAQLLLNAATQAYINMYSDPAFDRSLTSTGIWAGETEQLAQIEKWAEQAKTTEDVWKHSKDLMEAWQITEEETLAMQKEALMDYMTYLDSKGELTDEEIEIKERLRLALLNINEKIAEEEDAARQKSLEAQKKALQEQKDAIADTISQIQSYIEQFAGISKDITALARQNNEQERNEELTELSKQYTDGLISYEDYCEKKKQIERKAAQEEYKVKMWEWNVSILQATANIAEGISKAIAQGGIAGIITGALVAAAGAVQIASITASRPKPPAFAQGGVVGGLNGATTGGDNTYVHARTGEMILNAQQQRALWEAANGGGRGGATVNMPVTIENTASDKVSASAQMSPKGLQIIIRDIVRAQMENGDYSQSMAVGNNKNSGISYF